MDKGKGRVARTSASTAQYLQTLEDPEPRDGDEDLLNRVPGYDPGNRPGRVYDLRYGEPRPLASDVLRQPGLRPGQVYDSRYGYGYQSPLAQSPGRESHVRRQLAMSPGPMRGPRDGNKPPIASGSGQESDVLRANQPDHAGPRFSGLRPGQMYSPRHEIKPPLARGPSHANSVLQENRLANGVGTTLNYTGRPETTLWSVGPGPRSGNSPQLATFGNTNDAHEKAVKALFAPNPQPHVTNHGKGLEPVFSDKAMIIMAVSRAGPYGVDVVYIMAWIRTTFQNTSYRTPGYDRRIVSILRSDHDFVEVRPSTRDKSIADGRWRLHTRLRNDLKYMADSSGVPFDPVQYVKKSTAELVSRHAKPDPSPPPSDSDDDESDDDDEDDEGEDDDEDDEDDEDEGGGKRRTAAAKETTKKTVPITMRLR